MTHAIRIHETGGPEKMLWEEVEVGAPGEGEVRLRHTAVGLNFIDVYHRTGLYPLPQLPHVLGMEGCGIVEAVGDGVTEIAVGDRVAYAGVPPGAYAEERLIPWHRLVKVPEGISDQTAAAMMLQGMTACYLLRRCYRIEAGDTILVHAAAGGVGLISCQWAKALGATVIGTVGSPEKAELAKAHGCDHPILYREEDFVERVKELTEGKGVAAVYDSVGKDTFERSLDCLAPFGLLAAFGNASGPVPPISIGTLAAKGSLYVTRQTLFTHIATREATQSMAEDLFDVVRSGQVKIRIDQRYPLADVALAHRDLEARRTTGSSVLLP